MRYFAVIDTNVIVSALLNRASTPGMVLEEALTGRIIPIESRVAAPGPDVAEREYVFGRFVELIDLGGGNTVSVQNLTEGFATVDDLLFEPVVVGGNAV